LVRFAGWRLRAAARAFENALRDGHVAAGGCLQFESVA
jgi:hypothetical protein